MHKCYDCGIELEVIKTAGRILVYDSETDSWSEECPSCSGCDFHEQGREYIFRMK